MRVAPLYDRLLGMMLGLTRVDRDRPTLAGDCDAYLQTWAACALRVCHQLQESQGQPWGDSQQQSIAQAIQELWTQGERSHLERVFALSLGVFCWCDRERERSIWCEILSADCSAETRMGIELFTIVLRSFLREPPGRTVWLPLKRPTTIADLTAFSPEALPELQRTQHSMRCKTADPFFASTAIACQLPWYSTACKLVQRQAHPVEAQVAIGALLGAAFGPIAFEEDKRAVRPVNSTRQAVVAAIEPLWRTWTGSGVGATTVSLARVAS